MPIADSIVTTGFETRPITLAPLWMVAYQAPHDDVIRIFEAVLEVDPLVHGKTDSTAYRVTNGMEYYRPLEGTPTGAEDNIRHRPNVDEIRFFIPRDTALLDRVVNAIYEVHSYYEPVITVQEVLRSSCKGLDDSLNPHRWWNKTGDWKEKNG